MGLYRVTRTWMHIEADSTMEAIEKAHAGEHDSVHASIAHASYYERDVALHYTIYDHPADDPDHIVIREWAISRSGPVATGTVWQCGNLNAARTILANRGLIQIARDPSDDPVIVETWL